MKKGEMNILTAYSYNHFNETSGTVGVPKVIPMTDMQSAVFAKYNNLLVYGIMQEQVDSDWMNGRAFCTSSGTDTKYIHMCFALMDKEIRGIISGFYSVIVLFLKYIANNYELLIDDIEKGTISDEVDMPDEVR